MFITARRTGRLQRQAEWLLFIEVGPKLSPRYVRHLYGHRFGIETSYRCESARLDHRQKSRLSLCIAGAGLCVTQCVDPVALTTLKDTVADMHGKR
ncbi:MAG: hypothetical protein AB7G75_26060 [Candidatus Binatia bacterium]